MPLVVSARTKIPEKKDAPRVGNFALPASQQVFPMIAFGQNIIGKNTLQLTTPFHANFGDQSYKYTSRFQLLWGITNYLSLYATFPVTYKSKVGSHTSTGMNDMIFEMEGALYEGGDRIRACQVTLVGHVSVPTGSDSKMPSTGYGAPSFFAGSTFSYLDARWYAFASSGVVLRMRHDGIQPGGRFLYQTGFGGNIPTRPALIFDWLIEADGTLIWESKENGIKNSNTGGNTIYVSPSLFLSTMKWAFQAGVGSPVVQSLNGNQLKEYFRMRVDITYTF